MFLTRYYIALARILYKKCSFFSSFSGMTMNNLNTTINNNNNNNINNNISNLNNNNIPLDEVDEDDCIDDAISSSGEQPDPDYIKMFVGQVPKSMDEDQLKEMFEEYGRVHSINVLRDKVNGISKGKIFF